MNREVFVAFSVEDIECGNHITKFLNEHGCPVGHARKEGKACVEEVGQALGRAKCVIALWSAASAAKELVPLAARLASGKDILVNVLLEDLDQPHGFEFSDALNLSGWIGDHDDPRLKLLEERVRKVAGLAPTEVMVPVAPTRRTTSIPTRDSTVPKNLVRSAARLNLICDALFWVWRFLFWGVPLVACLIAPFIKLSNGWVVFCAVGGTAAAMAVSVIREYFDYRRECAREAVILEKARCDLRPFCLLLRSFTDPRLGYGFYYSQTGGKGHRSYEGPIRFRELAKDLAGVGQLLVLCRGTHEDAVLRTEQFEHIGMRAPDETWVQFFRYAVERCRAILVVPGASPGLLEEIHIIQSERSLLSKTLVFMPFTPPSRIGSTFFWEVDDIRLAWTRIQKEWSLSGLQLPDYRKTGILYSPKPDFSVDTTRREPSLPGAATLSEIISARIPVEETMCSSAEILHASESHGVTLLQTATAGAEDRLNIAITMLLMALLMVLVFLVRC